MHLRPEKLKSKSHKPLFELFEQPRICGKAANEKCELIVVNQELCSRITEYTDRVVRRALLEIILDEVHGRLNGWFEERRNLSAVCENVSAPIHQQSECEFTQSTPTSRPWGRKIRCIDPHDYSKRTSLPFPRTTGRILPGLRGYRTRNPSASLVVG